MAGAGFKTFATGEVLTASDVNTYLMQQTVMVFASSTARSTALGANVAEGMLSYLKDTKNTEYYNGSSWVVLSTGGDITGVTAGTGITGGGTSGDVTITNSMATAIDAKGDLIAGTADNTFARLAVGTDGQVLTAASGQTTGLQWTTPSAGGGMTLISTTTLSGSSVNLTSIPQTYKSLFIVIQDYTNATAGQLGIQCNSNSSHYGWGYGGANNYQNQGTAIKPSAGVNISTSTGQGNMFYATIYNYTVSNLVGYFAGGGFNGVTVGDSGATNQGRFLGGAAVTSLLIYNLAGGNITGTAKLYGVN